MKLPEMKTKMSEIKKKILNRINYNIHVAEKLISEPEDIEKASQWKPEKKDMKMMDRALQVYGINSSY